MKGRARSLWLTVSTLTILLLMVLLNAWNHGGTVYSPGAVEAYGFPFIYFRTHPTWTGSDWDFEHLRVTFFFVSLFCNILLGVFMLWAWFRLYAWIEPRGKEA
ncbi:MAG: hypothetical protein KIS92_03675 [Planctomycetota bacterium]|nr:hypothetical protein [Planctomycetota bacterium]